MTSDLKDMRQRAYDSFAEGDFATALEQLIAVRAQDGLDAEVANDIAVVLHRLGRTDDALVLFREAQALEGEGRSVLVDNVLDVLEQILKEQQRGGVAPANYVGTCEEMLRSLQNGSPEKMLTGFRHAIDQQKNLLENLTSSLLAALQRSLDGANEVAPNLAQAARCEGEYIHFPGVSLRCCVGDALFQQQSTDKCFVLGKTPSMVDALLSRLHVRPSNVLELGVWKGGSLVLFNELFRPRKLAVVDFMVSVVDPLVRYVEAHQQSVSLYLGTNQADQARLLEIVAETFGAEQLDLVLDDASHFYEESKVSFETLFPFVKANGLYVIEDWGWAQWSGEHWQQNEGGDYFRNRRPLANLIIELSLLAASRPGLISEVMVTSGSVYVRRGAEQCSGPICIDSLILNRGRPVPLLD